MDYISKRKNNIQSISIYCRPHQGLREEKPFGELPPLPLHPFSYQQRHGVTAAPRTGEPCWSSSDPCLIQREAFPLNQSLIPATLKQDAVNPAIHQPLLQALSSRTRRPIYGASKGIHYSETLSFSWCFTAVVSEATQGCSSTDTTQASHKPEN